MVLLNVDLGELPGEPVELYACAHLANLACGGHAGDDASMQRALELCLAHGAHAGAHPSYPDVAGFGRKAMVMAPAELRSSVTAQCARLSSLARGLHVHLGHVKPHGALYHAAHSDRAIATALVDGAWAALGGSFTVIGPSGGALAAVAAEMGLPFAREGFADRGTRPDGSLVPRGEPGALVLDPVVAAERARDLVRSATVDTVCVHGDTPGAVAIARAVREALG